MKIPVSWLSEYIDFSGVSEEKLSDALTMSGTENEIVKDGGSFPDIVMGEIVKIEKHPNADKLQVTEIKIGPNETLQIVCGAPNIEVGQKVPVALVGAQIGEFEIKETEIRGVKSFGMLASESELGISDDHSGIMILDPRAKVGANLGEALNIGGTVLEAEITPNRGDCLSVIGVAREVAATLGKKLKGLNFKKPEIKSNKKIAVEVKDKELCPRYIAKVVEGVKIGPSPKWMQDRLSAAGVRPISNVVDVTNYVMLEWGQPLHAFDGSKLSGKIIVRTAKAGEKIETLDGVSRTMTKNDLLICDSKKPVAVAGVMGGANSEVDEKTTTVVLEAAVFDRTSIRKTAQRLALRSEASNRFEKGIPLGLPEIAIERAAQLLAETSGGKAGENTDVLSKWIWVQHVGMRISRLEKFLGVKISVDRQIEILKSLGFEAEKFDFKKESRKHVGKPYVFGASFKTHSDMAFDCSYLTDYIYSQIGKFVGYTSLAQFELGTPVKNNDLKPGDILFVKGHIDKSATDHYFMPDGKGGYQKIIVKPPKEIGHNGIYVGNGRVIHARHYEYDPKTGKWLKNSREGKVVEEDVSVYIKNPQYLGARRYIEDPDDFIAITVPWWRLDIKIEEDIFEEIGRIWGYDKLPGTLPSGELPKFEDDKKLRMISEIKNVLAGAGLSEVLSYSFVSGKSLEDSGESKEKALKIYNPISPEQEYMRTNLIGSMLSNMAKNQDNFENSSIFEIASIYLPVKGEELPRELPTLGMLIKSQKNKNGDAFFKVKGALELIAEKLNLPEFELGKEESITFAKGRFAAVSLSGERIGILGEISEKTKAAFDIKYDCAVLQINLNKVADCYGAVRKYKTIPKYPTAVRDINVVFDEKVTASEILKSVNNIKNPIFISGQIVDIYEGGGLPQGKKSITIRLVFGASERTLEESEIASAQKDVLDLLKKNLSGAERS